MTSVLITGANRGIGLALTRHLNERGDDVIGVCRKSSAELDNSGARVIEGVDLGRREDVERLGREIGDQAPDWLLLNAGVMSVQRLGELDEDGMRHQFEVNALGPLRVADVFHQQLGEGAKVGIITSRMGSIADNTSGGSYGYRMSKAAVNMAGKSLAEDLRPRGIAVFLLHPGFVRTDMVGGNGQVDPSEAAANLVARMDELSLEQTGTFWHANGEPLPW